MAALTDSTDTFRFREGAGRICLDFVRTLRLRGTAEAVDELADPAALAAWVRQLGPCAPDAPAPAPSTELLGWARELREAVLALLLAARTPEGLAHCPPEARQLVNQAAEQSVPVPVLEASGSLGWRADDPVAATLALVARDALDLAASPLSDRVRECASDSCAALFLDSSRPGTRRWCSMDACGNQAKKAAFRERAAS